VVLRQTMADSVTPVTVTSPSGATRELTLSASEPGTWRSTIPANELGLWQATDGTLKALINVGPTNPKEFSEVTSTTEMLKPLTQATGGDTRRVVDGSEHRRFRASSRCAPPACFKRRRLDGRENARRQRRQRRRRAADVRRPDRPAAAARRVRRHLAARGTLHEIRHRPPARRPGPARAAARQARGAARPSRFGHRRPDAFARRAGACGDIKLTAAFGPQHGLRGDKQDNMVESAGLHDPVHGIPVFSLYGEVRRPTDAMMDTFDVMLVDLQDLGCRIYTFITTLRYVLEAAAKHGKAVWVLDRPNPIGRPVEGLKLRPAGRASSAPGPCRCATA
jgi:hypothetical protein